MCVAQNGTWSLEPNKQVLHLLLLYTSILDLTDEPEIGVEKELGFLRAGGIAQPSIHNTLYLIPSIKRRFGDTLFVL